jgi:hypothetical protein
MQWAKTTEALPVRDTEGDAEGVALVVKVR